MNTDENAKIIWDYMHMGQPLQKADAIFVLCSIDTRGARLAADLYAKGYAGWVIVSGGFGRLSKDKFGMPEAQLFARIIEKAGVPFGRIIIEDKSTNSGDNIRFTYNLLKKLGKNFSSFILVQKPYMERRTFATFKKQWPDSSTRISVTSIPVKYEDYFNESLPKDLVVNVMVGDLQRIKEYPALGYQIPQEIPDKVWRAYENLVAVGFSNHLLK
ncbi:MAG: YdcF family protein [Candidatus Saccharibacteria bacterium]|nr:YdcF family protein [Candidatus Saccharibacteria bacterium]